MVMEIWDYVNETIRRLRGDASGRAVTLPEGQYLATPGTLDDEEYHHFTLTVDKKLRTDDPTAQGLIQDAIDLLEDGTFGVEALKDLIDAFEAAIKGGDWSVETLKRIYDDITNELLGSRWNISTTTYLQNFSIATQEVNPSGVFFKPDGMKMYVIGTDGDDVNEYDLGTAWDISTVVYLRNFSVSPQDTIPTDVFFNPAGTKMYMVGYNGQDINEYDLSTPWNISTAVYLRNFVVTTQDTIPTDVFFKPDGTKMYVLGYAEQDVFEYDLGTPWNISTAVYLRNFSVGTEETEPAGFFFKPDGIKMYVIGSVGDDVNEYTLGIAWDISTAVYLRNFSVAGEELVSTGLFFKPDGTKMYVIGSDGDDVNEYDLGTYRLAELDAANIPADIDALTTAVGAIPTTPELEADALTRYNALAAYVDEIETYIKHGTYGLAQLETLVDEIETYIKHATYGLAQLDTEHGTLATAIGNIPTTPALAATLEDAMQKATGPSYNQDTDSQEAIREVCDSIVTVMS